MRKKLDAWGRFEASSDGIEVGLLIRSGTAAMRPELNVTIKNECYNVAMLINIQPKHSKKKKPWKPTMTWKIKKRVIKESSKPVYLGIPSNLASRRSTIGRSNIRTASNTGGRIPAIMPITTSGRSDSHASQETVVRSLSMFDTNPTKVTICGNDQIATQKAV